MNDTNTEPLQPWGTWDLAALETEQAEATLADFIRSSDDEVDVILNDPTDAAEHAARVSRQVNLEWAKGATNALDEVAALTPEAILIVLAAHRRVLADGVI